MAPEKKSSWLRVSRDFSLPARRYAESHGGVYGGSGRGKSSFVRVLGEALHRSETPVSYIDPIGLYWGLRSSFDGRQPSGIRVLVVNGDHGDVRVGPEAGYELAEVICDMGISVVLDLSLMTPKEYRKFVAGYADGTFRANQKTRHVIIEEASEFLPIRDRPSTEQVSESMTRLVVKGRNRAVGTTIVCQRLASLSADAKTQVDTMFVFGMVSPRDREAVAEWVEGKAGANLLKRLEDGLASLGRREAWVWSPEMFDLFQPFFVRTFTTLHPDRTHLSRHNITKGPKAMTDVSDLVSQVRDHLGSAVEKHSLEEENATLLAKVADLQKRMKETSIYIGPDLEVVEKAVSDAVAKAETEYRKKLDGVGHRLRVVAESIQTIVGEGGQKASRAARELRTIADEAWR